MTKAPAEYVAALTKIHAGILKPGTAHGPMKLKPSAVIAWQRNLQMILKQFTVSIHYFQPIKIKDYGSENYGG